MRFAVLVFGSAICGALLGLLFSGCTPAHQAAATQHTVTGFKIAACVQGVLAEEDRERQRMHREAEIAAELEAERLREEAAEPKTTAEQIDAVIRDGGTKE